MPIPSRATIIKKLGGALDTTKVGRKKGATLIRQAMELSEGQALKPTLENYLILENILYVTDSIKSLKGDPERMMEIINDILEGDPDGPEEAHLDGFYDVYVTFVDLGRRSADTVVYNHHGFFGLSVGFHIMDAFDYIYELEESEGVRFY